MMKVSFTLCTKNGGDRLVQCLSHIEALNAPASMELFLIDNGSTDSRSYEILKHHATITRFDCQVYQTLTPGNSAGRNVALSKASGDIHIFIDDDCYVEPDMVSRWIEIFETSPIGFASGMTKRYDLSFSNLGCDERTIEEIVRPGGYVRRGLIQGSNMAFRRECLEAAGPFDVRFGAGTPYAGEEWDVALRAAFCGYGGGYFPGPRVAHDHRRIDAESRSRLLYYDFGAGAVYAKNTFARRGWLIILKLLRDLIRVRADPPRIAMIIKGYFDYYKNFGLGSRS